MDASPRSATYTRPAYTSSVEFQGSYPGDHASVCTTQCDKTRHLTRRLKITGTMMANRGEHAQRNTSSHSCINEQTQHSARLHYRLHHRLRHIIDCMTNMMTQHEEPDSQLRWWGRAGGYTDVPKCRRRMKAASAGGSRLGLVVSCLPCKVT